MMKITSRNEAEEAFRGPQWRGDVAARFSAVVESGEGEEIYDYLQYLSGRSPTPLMDIGVAYRGLIAGTLHLRAGSARDYAEKRRIVW